MLVSFRNLYSFMSQIIPFQDADLEKLYAFIRLLIPRLPKRGIGPAMWLDDEVALRYYRLQQTSDGSIALVAGERGIVPAPTAVGTGKIATRRVELSRLIDVINERFGTDFKPADQLFFESIKEDAVAKPALRQAALANSMENFGYVFMKELQNLFLDRMSLNEDITARYLDDNDFRDAVGRKLLQEVYDQIHAADKEQAENGMAHPA